ncbi:hypothetical protein ACFLXE_08120, partial [Chloroflexota bacterium]
NDEVKRILWVRRVAPDLHPFRAWVLAGLYLDRADCSVDTADLDNFVGFAPWRNRDALTKYTVVCTNGWIPVVPFLSELVGGLPPGKGLAYDKAQDEYLLARDVYESLKKYLSETLRETFWETFWETRRTLYMLDHLLDAPSRETLKHRIDQLRNELSRLDVEACTEMDGLQADAIAICQETLQNKRDARLQSAQVRIDSVKNRLVERESRLVERKKGRISLEHLVARIASQIGTNVDRVREKLAALPPLRGLLEEAISASDIMTIIETESKITEILEIMLEKLDKQSQVDTHAVFGLEYEGQHEEEDDARTHSQEGEELFHRHQPGEGPQHRQV